MPRLPLIIFVLIIIVLGFTLYRNGDTFDLPEGETVSLEEAEQEGFKNEKDVQENENMQDNTLETAADDTGMIHEDTNTGVSRGKSQRTILVTDKVKHSIPLEEIRGGGPPKDGIPSIDEPSFVSVSEADFLDDQSIGLGVAIDGDVRFYPYMILVWHELVNDMFGDRGVLVSYCPLCATGVVFDRSVGGTIHEFGVSGLLWQSNLLMYNRTGDADTESLWSQVLGEAVLGPETGSRLEVISSNTVRYGDWKKMHPNTRVLSKDTGALRTYGVDPYGDYYTDNEAVLFPVAHTDTRLPNKAYVLGVELNGKFKAYEVTALPTGETVDTFAGETLRIEKHASESVRMFIGENEVPYIGGFWFSWVAVHPMTEIWTATS